MEAQPLLRMFRRYHLTTSLSGVMIGMGSGSSVGRSVSSNTPECNVLRYFLTHPCRGGLKRKHFTNLRCRHFEKLLSYAF